MINGQKEIWVKVPHNRKPTLSSAMAISNCGRIMNYKGEIRDSYYRECIFINNVRYRVYRLLAEIFIPKTENDIILKRNVVDHITHDPIGISINDIRNLRWCTQLENDNFQEKREHLSKSLKGKKPTKDAIAKIVAKNTGKVRSEFAIKFKLHYNETIATNPKLYWKERSYYRTHGKCRWE